MTITLEDARRVLHEVVAENPDYVYERIEDAEGVTRCVYSTREGNPSCIVGHVIYRLDPAGFERIHTQEWADEDRPMVTTVYHVNINALDRKMDARAVQFLNNAQSFQDSGYSWKEAEDEAEAHMHYNVQK